RRTDISCVGNRGRNARHHALHTRPNLSQVDSPAGCAKGPCRGQCAPFDNLLRSLGRAIGGLSSRLLALYVLPDLSADCGDQRRTLLVNMQTESARMRKRSLNTSWPDFWSVEF